MSLSGPVARWAVRGLAASLVVAGWACRGDDAGRTAAGSVPLLPTGPVVERTITTVDLAAITGCRALAGALVPLWDSLGDLTVDEANRLDPALITEIGRHLRALEQRRVELGCEAEQWRIDSCAAAAGSHSPMAQRLTGTACAAPASTTAG